MEVRVRGIQITNEREMDRFIQNHAFRDIPLTVQALEEIGKLQTQDSEILSRQQRRLINRVIKRLGGKVGCLTPENYLQIIEYSINSGEPYSYALVPLGIIFGEAEKPKDVVFICRLLLRSIVRYYLNADGKITEALLILSLSPLITSSQRNSTWRVFLEMVVNGHQQELFLQWVQFFLQMSPTGLELVPLSEFQKANSVGERIRIIFPPNSNIALPIPDELIPPLAPIVEGCINKIQQIQEEKIRFVCWFNDNFEWFQEAWRKMWKEVIDDRQYGLRPGEDTIRIGIRALHSGDFKFTAFEYLKEGISSPWFKVRIYWEFVSESSFMDWVIYPLPLSREAIGFGDNRQGDTVFNPDLLNNNAEKPTDLHYALDVALAYLALWGYWRIVTGKKNPLKTKPPKGVRPRVEDLPKAVTAVRWHFRTIAGKASEQAISRSVEIAGQQPPEGKTFVRPHQRKVSQIGPSGPIYTIKEQDIGYPG